MTFIATARWSFRGETWFSAEIEAHSLDAAGAAFYSMLPITFFRGNNRLVAIRPADAEPSEMMLQSQGADDEPSVTPPLAPPA